MSKNKLYLLVAAVTALGCAWVLYNIVYPTGIDAPELCLFKHVTGLPCPSCGSTHAVIRLLHLDWRGAFYDNPLGYVVAIALPVLPSWVAYDVAGRKCTFFLFYRRAEAFIRRRWVGIPLVVLLAINWIWSIYKFTA